MDPDNEDTIISLSDDYQMDLYTTGNVYMTYPAYGKTLADWDYGKQMNLDSIVTPYLTFEGYVTEENASMMAELDALSADIMSRIEKMSAAEFEDAISDLKKELKDSAVLTAATGITETDIGPCAVYNAYFTENYPS